MNVMGFLNSNRFKAMCGGKQKHASQGKAEAAARSYKQRFDGDEVEAYFCRYCRSWHIGHKKP